MAEDTAPAAPEATPTGTPDADKPGTDDTPKTFTQEQVNDLIAKEKGKIQSRYVGFDDLKAKAEELDRIKEANATELEKAQGKATKEKERAEAAEAKLLRFEVAKDKEVPAEAVDLLQGATRDELEASADKLLKLVKAQDEEPKPPEFNGGPRPPAPEPKTPEQAHNETVLGLLQRSRQQQT